MVDPESYGRFGREYSNNNVWSFGQRIKSSDHASQSLFLVFSFNYYLV
jgi:hypothetical protein